MTRLNMTLVLFPLFAVACAAPRQCPPREATAVAKIETRQAAAPSVEAQPPAEPPDPLTFAEALSDTREFLNLLESSHPDPYTGFGGKVAFKLAMNDLLESLPKEGMSRKALADTLSRFIVRLRDGNTMVASPSDDGNGELEAGLMMEWIVTSDLNLFIRAANYQQLKKKLGYRLDAINGVSVEELLDRVERSKPCDNRFDAMCELISMLNVRDYLAGLADLGQEDIVPLSLVSPGGKKETVEIDLKAGRFSNSAWLAELSSWDRLEKEAGLFQAQVFGKEKLAYLRIGEFTGREALEILAKMDLPDESLAQEDGLAKLFFEQHGLAEAEVKDKTLADVPSFLELTTPLLERMKLDGLETLVIDLRGNTRGYACMAELFLYQLFGDEYFAHHRPDKYLTVVSDLYLQKFGKSIEEARAEMNRPRMQVGDYDSKGDDSKLTPAERREKAMRDEQGEKYSFARLIEREGGEPLYEPKRIVVIVGPETWSLASNFLFKLQSMGAAVVGVPPSESPNSFAEVTPFELRRSRLCGTISNSFQLLYPERMQAREFDVDFPLTYAIAKRYRFDTDASVRYAFDLVKSGAIDKAKEKKANFLAGIEE